MTTDYSSTVTNIYQSIAGGFDPPAADLATYVALMTNSNWTEAQVAAAIQTEPFIQDVVNPIIREYQAAFGRVPDQGGLKYWIGVVAPNGPTGDINTAAFDQLATIFSGSTEFQERYGAGFTPSTVVTAQNGSALVVALYTNVLGRAPDASGLAYWLSSGNTVSQLLTAFAESPEFIADTAVAVNAFENAQAAGNAPTEGSLYQFASSNLTTGADQVSSGYTVTGDLTNFSYDGVGPTLNSTDVINNVTNLVITDGYAQGTDVIPAGAHLSNIANVTLQTLGNAGTGGAAFSTVGISGVQTLTVQSSGGGDDLVQGAQTTAINVQHSAHSGAVSVEGGSDVTVVSNAAGGDAGGDIFIGSDDGLVDLSPNLASLLPTGNVSVTDNGGGAYEVSVLGGQAVTVNLTSLGNTAHVDIGNTLANTGDMANAAVAIVNPTGAITVTDAGQDGDITIYGGSSVTVTASGDCVTVGDPNATAASNNTTGAISVRNIADTTWSNDGGQQENVHVSGGSSVSVTTNTGNVLVGDYDGNLNADGTAALAGAQPTGAVTVVDTATADSAFVEVDGGADVTINTPDTVSAINVSVGTFTAVEGKDDVVLAPTGDVTIYDNAATTWAGAYDYVNSDAVGVAGSGHEIDVLGGADVQISTNTASVHVGGDDLNAAGKVAVPGQNPTGDVTIIDTATAQDGCGVSVEVDGGKNVSVTVSGAHVSVGAENEGIVSAPTGDVTITNTAVETVAYDGSLDSYDDSVAVLGGANVTITTNTGSVLVGEDGAKPSAGSEPTGAVSVIDNSAGSVEVYGGATVNVTSAGGAVQVGDGASLGNSASSNPTGAVTVTQSAIDTGGLFDSSVNVQGGTDVRVDTTGGNVIVGESSAFQAAAPVTGAVVINDTFGGIASDDITVAGGTTVSIHESASQDNSIVVGLGISSDPTTLLSDLQNDGFTASDVAAFMPAAPTGNVTIVDATVNGSTTTYGQEQFFVATNGGSSVSVTGGAGDHNVIADIQSIVPTTGTGAGSAVGTSTLATVSLTGVTGTTTILSDALATVSVADTQCLSLNVYDDTAKSALTLNLDNANTFLYDQGGQNAYLNAHSGQAYVDSLTINATGSDASSADLKMNDLTALTINNASGFTLGVTELNSLASITVTGAGTTDLTSADEIGSHSLASIDASAATGDVYVEFNPNRQVDTHVVTSFTGGAGNDVVILDSAVTSDDLASPNFTGESITGGGGVNTIYADYAASDGDLPVGNNGVVFGFQNLGVVGDADGAYSAAGFSSLLVGAAVPNGEYYGFNGYSQITFDHIAPNATLDLIATDGLCSVTLELETPYTNGGGLSVTVGQDASATHDGTTGVGYGATVDISENGITSLTIDSQGQAGICDANVLNIENQGMGPGVGLTSITITGDADIQVNVDQCATTITTIDASAATGGVDVSNLQSIEASTGVTITGGSGGIIAGGVVTCFTDTGPVDTYNIGAGGGIISLGTGGAGFETLGTNFVSGSETINLTAGAMVGTVIEANQDFFGFASGPVPVGAHAIVNNWNIATVASGGATTDAIVLKDGARVITNGANVSASTVSGISGIYNISNGVISLANNSPTVDGAHELSDALAIVDSTATTGTIALVTIPVVQDGGTILSTFLIQEGCTGGASDTVIELNGVSGLTGFGGISSFEQPGFAGNISAGTSLTLGTVDYASLFANVSLDTGSAETATANHSVDDTGYALDTIGNLVSFGHTYTYANLANFGILQGATTSGGDVVVTQSGIDSILTVTATGDLDLGSLTYGNAAVANDDPTLLLYANQGSIHIGSIVDASNTGTDLVITGSHSVEVDGVTDSALTTVDASTLFSSLTLTANQDHLTIVGSSYGDVITANGVADTISVDGACSPSITANGAGDTINLTDVGGGHLGLAGANDVVNLTDSGTVYGTGNGVAFSDSSNELGHATQLAAGDTINVSSSSLHAWLGANSTVNLASCSSADLHLLNDTAGASLTNMTTISGLGGGSSVYLHFNDVNADGSDTSVTTEAWAAACAANSQVNVASATSLAQALDIAASQTLVLNQATYGSASTIVHQNTAQAAYQLDGHSGLVDWFQYGGDTYLVEAVNSGSSNAAHGGLAANDIVVKLTGLVDMSHVDAHFVGNIS